MTLSTRCEEVSDEFPLFEFARLQYCLNAVFMMEFFMLKRDNRGVITIATVPELNEI
jgi:hypothetical protein